MSTVSAPQRLGNLLIERGYLTLEQLESALSHQHETGKRKLLGEILVDLEYCSEDQVVECLAAEYGVPYAKLESRLFDQKIVDVLPREYIEKNLVLPLFIVRKVLTIAVAEPANMFLIDELRRLTEMEVQIVATSSKDIRRMITTLPDSKVFVIDDIIEDSDQAEVTLIEEAIEDIGDVEEIAGQSPVIRLVNYIIYNAVKEGASDIHIEPAERCMRIRNRIDGRLYKALEVPQHLLGAVTSRIKIMASLDISERRLPQDGRVHVMLDGRKIDLRVSTFPGSRGEKSVIRVLDTRNVSLNLRELGFAEDILGVFQQQITSPNGIILVTGPTGSGKTTTLYASLIELNTPDRKLLTVEDPIEYQLDGVNQVQTKAQIGLSFAHILRSMLRHDPDVIMIGEIRDLETAQIAIQAALTGHLVLSTLHTNNAASTLTRLLDMGVEDYLLPSTLNAIVAQRLVRRLCQACREQYTPLPELLAQLGLEDQSLRFWRPSGCDVCSQTGYSGRISINEILVMNDAIRKQILQHAESTELQRTAVAAGMRLMLQDGIAKVTAGLTSIEEVMRVTREIE